MPEHATPFISQFYVNVSRCRRRPRRPGEVIQIYLFLHLEPSRANMGNSQAITIRKIELYTQEGIEE